MQTVSVLVEFFRADDSAFVICLSGKDLPSIVGVDVFRKGALEKGVADMLSTFDPDTTGFKILISNPNNTKVVLGLLKRIKDLGVQAEFTNAHFIRQAQIGSARMDVSDKCVGQSHVIAGDVAEGFVPQWIRLACIRATQLWTLVS